MISISRKANGVAFVPFFPNAESKQLSCRMMPAARANQKHVSAQLMVPSWPNAHEWRNASNLDDEPQGLMPREGILPSVFMCVLHVLHVSVKRETRRTRKGEQIHNVLKLQQRLHLHGRTRSVGCIKRHFTETEPSLSTPFRYL